MPPSAPAPAAKPVTPRPIGLVLTGGGARAAYQVGVLEAISDLRMACGAGREPNPFPIITGTSAGAINAAALACGADQFDRAVRRIARVWRNFHAQQVYRADSLSVMRSGAGWLTLMSLGWLLARWRRMRPRSLLDNTPLTGLLTQLVPLVRLPRLIRQGHLQALAITASSYSSGEHVTFFEAAQSQQPWVRSQRKATRDRITHDHLLASSAIPFVFPATALGIDGHTEYFGDGSMRQSARSRRPSTWGPNASWWWARAACTSRRARRCTAMHRPTRRSRRSPGTRCPTSSWTPCRWMWSAPSASTRRFR